MNSTNKIKTTWEIVNQETCRKARNAAFESFNIDSRIINNQQHIADTFNSYFLSIADNININNNSPLQSMSQINKSDYKTSRRKPTTTFEIEKIMKSLKS